MNSSALSDDGKFSTRALRGFGPTSDLEGEAYNVDIPTRMPDAMGLSTQVEISDRGSRRADMRHANDDEMIEEVEQDDESGRTGPAGTIGEPHDCVSENIESNILQRLKKGGANQSAKGMTKETQGVRDPRGRQFVQDESSVTACSNFAVIREKIALTNNNEHVRAFDRSYDQIFQDF